MTRPLATCTVALLLMAGPVLAGIPCLVDPDGRPLTWSQMPIVYNLPPSLAGVTFGSRWEAQTSAVSFVAGPALPEEVTRANYRKYLGVCGDGLNPIVIDRDGSILDGLMGKGARRAVGGVTSHDCRDGAGREILKEFSVVFNGTLSLPGAQSDLVRTHELGHVLNLCHSQLNGEFVDDGFPSDDDELPVMFAKISRDGGGSGELRFDDLATLSLLYPPPGFFATTGTIAGHVLGPAGRAISGAGVVVRDVADPRAHAFWSSSGWVRVEGAGPTQGTEGAGEPAIAGSFQASGLPPGQYTVQVEPGTVVPAGDYYSGVDESADPVQDPPGLQAIVAVSAGGVFTDADILLSAGVASPLADTRWSARWQLSVSSPDERVRFSKLPKVPRGELELLSTGAYRVSPPVVGFVDGTWSDASRRRVRHRLDLDRLRRFFQVSIANATPLAGSGRSSVNRTGSRIAGVFVVRARLEIGPRPLIFLRLTFHGRRAPDRAGEPGRVPIVAAPLAQTP